ncbi:MAG: OmpA family protein [Sphingopyxis sp.]|uniref:OmpA family protein n=1 Tax=Sphingopyxis bauzanensis TaxID=651663 RepID=UPI00199ACC56|nr:OmpA family protein [Sphingopyxis bauzanensis]MDP3784295.1 OmpA family protein [Sphingopyxis sp.]GGJ35312.1 cell envelope biogenesis protein OmpA [Sphingopyxis bauzanensis]
MTQTFPHLIRSLLLIVCASLLAACQSVPQQRGFTAEQVAVLKAEGFVEDGPGWALSMPERLLFSTDESSVPAEQQARITDIASKLVSVGITTARVEGHTDSTGTAAYNLTLSNARAQAIAAPMQAGGMQFTPDQIIGRGEAVPMSSNDTEEGRQDNRRVVVIVTP